MYTYIFYYTHTHTHMHVCSYIHICKEVICEWLLLHSMGKKAAEIDIHTYIYACIHAIHLLTYIFDRKGQHTCIHTAFIHTYIRAYIHRLNRSETYIHTCIHTYIHTYAYIHKHTYIHTYILRCTIKTTVQNCIWRTPYTLHTQHHATGT